MAQLVRFEQDPDAPEGAGMFHFDSGAKQYAYEPELAARAGNLKSALDAAPDNRLAQNSPPPMLARQPEQLLPGYQKPDIYHAAERMQAANAHDWADTPGARADTRDAAIVARANDAVAQATGTLPAGVPASLAREPAAPALPPPTSADMAGAAREAIGQRAAEDLLRGTKRVYAPGTPGVDPHKMISQGVMVPTAQGTVTESGAPYDPAQARERIGAAKEMRDAQLDGMQLEEQQTRNQLASQRALAPKLEEAAAHAQDNHNRMIASYRMDRSRLQQDLDDYEKNAHINPDRYFQDRGLFATIGMAIAQGMGAYASTVSGAPNFAFEMVQKAIDRDIAAQRDEIDAGRVSRRNKLASMMDNYGYDLQQSEAALRIAMNKSADMQAQMFANESKLPHYQNEARKFNALTQQKVIENEQALYNASIGKRTRTQQEAFVQPKAATGPGYVERPLSAEEITARAKLLPDGATTPGQDWHDLKPEQRVEAIGKYADKKREFSDSRSSLSDMADAYGLNVDWKTGTVTDKNTGKPVQADDFTLLGSHEGIPGVGLPSFDRQGARRVKETRDLAAAQAGKALSGSSVSPTQNEQIVSSLLSDDDAGAVRGLQRAVAALSNAESGVDTTAPEEARQEYKRRQLAVTRERKTAPPAVKVSEY